MEYNEFEQENSYQIENKKTKNKHIKNQKTKKEKRKKKKSRKIKILFILFLFAAILSIIAINYNNTIRHYKEEKTNLVINSNNVTKRLKGDVIIKDSDIYVSMGDINNFFDKYILLEETENKIITTGTIVTAEISFEEGQNIIINGATSKIQAHAIKENDVIYLPISKMANIYNIETKYIEETNTVVINSTDREIKQATITKNSILREKRRNILSDALEKLNENDIVYLVSEDYKGWTKVRTTKGKVGYVKTDILSDSKIVQEEYSYYSENKIDGKINMFWDYFSESTSAPDRTGEYIEGVNVVSPAFFYIDSNGKLKENIGTAGKKYIEWAKSNNYQIWPRVANDVAGIDVTSELINNYTYRKEFINDLVNACILYDLDGVNMDFEYMYQKDKDAFSHLIIEMVPIMKGSGGLVVSVDVTAPDGGANWSLCYDRNVLGDVADYLVFMAYDQYNNKTAGTTAGYDWVKNNIEKFIKNEEVPSEKIILAIPFYTRIWTEINGEVSSKVVFMKNINSEIPSGVEKEWNDKLKQYYIEYTSGNSIKKMWIEDLESIKIKCELVNTYNLAGVSAWEKDREDPDVWEVINEVLN